jgi:hypothetical protein
MSRTDKDAPYWVRADFYKPDHDWNCPDRIARSWQHYPRVEACTLPAEPTRTDVHWPRTRKIPEVPQCRWVPAGWDRRYHTLPPRHYDRRIYFHGPSRREIRDFCIKARQEYFGSGDVESMEPGKLRCALDWWD